MSMTLQKQKKIVGIGKNYQFLSVIMIFVLSMYRNVQQNIVFYYDHITSLATNINLITFLYFSQLMQ